MQKQKPTDCDNSGLSCSTSSSLGSEPLPSSWRDGLLSWIDNITARWRLFVGDCPACGSGDQPERCEICNDYLGPYPAPESVRTIWKARLSDAKRSRRFSG